MPSATTIYYNDRMLLVMHTVVHNLKPPPQTLGIYAKQAENTLSHIDWNLRKIGHYYVRALPWSMNAAARWRQIRKSS